MSEAETVLDQVVGEIRVELRGEKIGMTTAVEDAFAKLRRAKDRLVDLEARLSSATD